MSTQSKQKMHYVEVVLWFMGVAAVSASLKVSWPALSHILKLA